MGVRERKGGPRGQGHPPQVCGKMGEKLGDRMAVEDACAHSMAFRCGMWEVLWLHRKYLVARVAAALAT